MGYYREAFKDMHIRMCVHTFQENILVDLREKKYEGYTGYASREQTQQPHDPLFIYD
jgi:hypothetical protein